MANGHIWSVWIDYDGTTLQVALADNSVVRPANIISHAINIPAFIGSTSAFVGFTGATGSGFENQDILNWQLVQRFAPINTVPQPSSYILLGSLIGLFGMAYKRRRQAA